MRYYVVWPDGQKFGPADISTLRLWAAEKRIGPSTVLMEEGSGRQLPATSLQDLQGVLLAPFSGPPGTGNPYTPPGYSQGYPGYTRQGSSEVKLAWVFGAIGLIAVCCPFGYLFSVAGIVLAALAMGKKQSGAVAALIFACLTLVLPLVLGVLIGLVGGSLPNF